MPILPPEALWRVLAKEGRALVFVDESGLSERPGVVRIGARKGQAGITWWEFDFRLFRGSLKSRQAVEFLGHWRRQIPGRLPVIRDGLAVHRRRRRRATSLRAF